MISASELYCLKRKSTGKIMDFQHMHVLEEHEASSFTFYI